MTRNGDDGHQVRVERGSRLRPPEVARQASEPEPRGREGDHPAPAVERGPRGGQDGRLARCRQRLGKLGGRAEAVGRHLGERAHHGLLHALRHGGAHGPKRRHRIHRVARQQLLGGGPDERRLAREHLVQHAAERVQVAPSVQLPAGAGLLRAHVRGGAEREPGLGQPVLAGGGDGARDPEVRHDRLVAFQQDVFRLDIAVDDAVRMGVAQGAQHLGGDPHGLIERQLALAHAFAAGGIRPPRRASCTTAGPRPRPSRARGGCADAAGERRS